MSSAVASGVWMTTRQSPGSRAAILQPMPSNTDPDLQLSVPDVLKARTENPKCDFKREVNLGGEQFGELVKDLCALANTDDDRYGGKGVLLLGVEDDGSVSGLPDTFHADEFSQQLTQRLKTLVSPPLRFEVHPPIQDPDGGERWSAIVIDPPDLLPHLTIAQTGRVTAGQWFIRHNTTTLAGPEEFAKLHRRLINLEIRPLQSGLDRVAADLSILREDVARLRVDALTGRMTSPADVPGVSVAQAVRAQYETAETRLAARIRQQGRELTSAIVSSWEDGWSAPSRLSAEAFEAVLGQLENLARPIAETAFEVIAHVDDDRILTALRDAFQ